MLHVVIGANGAVGASILEDLNKRGIPGKGAGRNPKGGWIKLDLLNLEDCRTGLQGVSHVHVCAGFPYQLDVWRRDWPLAMSNIIDAAAKNDTKIVFLDNIYMYGPTPLKNPITEEHSQQPTSQKGQIRKQIAEQLLGAHRDGRVKALIARAPDFYGPHATNSLLYPMMIQPMIQNRVARWIGGADLPHSFGYTPDIGRAMVELALNPDADGQVWHTPTQASTINAQTLHAMIARELGSGQKLSTMGRFGLNTLSLVVPVLREVKEMAYQYFSEYVFSSAKFGARFPNFAVTPYDEGIRETVRSFRTTASG